MHVVAARGLLKQVAFTATCLHSVSAEPRWKIFFPETRDDIRSTQSILMVAFTTSFIMEVGLESGTYFAPTVHFTKWSNTPNLT